MNGLCKVSDTYICSFCNNGVDTGGLVIGPWTTFNRGIRIDGSNGYVGIGTSNPQAQLHISSNLRVDGSLSVYSSVQFTGFELIPGQIQNNYTQIYASTSNIQGYSNMVYGISGSNGTMLSIMSNTSNDSFRFVSGATSNELMRINGNGYVGIGTSNPISKFTIRNLYSDGINGGFCIDSSDGAIYNLTLSSYVQSGGKVAYNFVVNNQGSQSTALSLGYNGYVGIGALYPAYALDVNGSVNVNKSNLANVNKLLVLYDGNSTDSLGSATSFFGFGINTAAIRYQVQDKYSSHIFYGGVVQYASLKNTGLAIGPLGTTQYGKLYLGSGLGSNDIVIEAGNTTSSNNIGFSAINFNGYYNNADTSINTNKCRWRMVVDQQTTSDQMFIDSFSTGGGLVRSMTFTSNGYVGIGTSNPQATLDVTGSAKINGIFLATVADNSFIGPWVNAANLGFVKRYAQGTVLAYNNLNQFRIAMMNQADISTNISTARYTDRLVIDTSGTVTISGSLSKGSGTFDIQHPLLSDSNHRLIHSFIEGPRCDLIYRGKINLINGEANVNIDTDCVSSPECAMTEGTFISLCANPQYFLQPTSSFERVYGTITGSILKIISENTQSSAEIGWQIIAERKDNFIKKWNRTNKDGYLVTEYIREEQN